MPLLRGHVHFQAVREKGDDLFRHFRSLMDGVKELKLHEDRRRAFLEEQLQGTAVKVQGHAVAAQRAFSSAVSWGQVLIFLLIGVVAFVLPAFTPVERQVLTGFTFAILYMVGPMQAILNAMAPLSRAIVAMDRVEQMGMQLEEAARPEPGLLPGVPATEWRSLELEGVTHTYHSEPLPTAPRALWEDSPDVPYDSARVTESTMRRVGLPGNWPAFNQSARRTGAGVNSRHADDVLAAA